MILKNRPSSFFHLIGLGLIALSGTVATAQDKVDFVKEIKPIFESKCVVCHGPVEKEDQENDFRIDDREDAMDYIGTDGAENSDLFMLLISDDEGEVMPPPEHGKLTAAQIKLVKTWIDEGADWPEGVELVDTSQLLDAGDATPVKTDPVGGSNDGQKNDDPTSEADPKDDQSKEDEPKDDQSKDTDKNDAAPPLTTDKKTQQIFNATGSLHPAAVHLPIGLLLASGLFALFSLRGNFVMSDCAYYCLWLGTIGAIAACLSGWWYSPMEHKGTVAEFGDLFDQAQPVFWHRTGGLIMTALALLLALFATGARNRDPDDGMLWKLGLILLAAGIGWVGHSGGELAYPNQYKDLNAIFERIMAGDQPEGEANQPEGEANQSDARQSS